MHRGNAKSGARVRSPRELLVRPLEQNFRQAFLAALALLLPLFAVLLWLTLPTSWLPLAILAILIAMGLTALLVVTYRRARVKVTPAGIQECGLWGWRPYVPRDDVSSVMFVTLYRGSSLDVEDNLFVIGHDNKTALRMRGRFWDSGDMKRIIDLLGAPATIVSETQSMEEFRREHSRLLYAHERRANPFQG